MSDLTRRERLTAIAAALSAISAIASGVVLAFAFAVLGEAQRLAVQPAAAPVLSAVSQRPTADVHGTVLLTAGHHQPIRDNTECGADKIAGGMLIWVADGNGDAVAEGRLAAGKLDQHGGCRLDFTVAGVPSGALRYTMSFESPAITAINIVDLSVPVQVFPS